MASALDIILIILFITLACIICCASVRCASICDDLEKNNVDYQLHRTHETHVPGESQQLRPTPVIYFVVINEIITTREVPQILNMIPRQFSNLRPKQAVPGWTQGLPVKNEILSDAHVPVNAKPPEISDDD